MKSREREAERAEERAERMAAIQEDNLKQRLADLAAREAEINRAGERHELLVQETRSVVRRQLELEYAERLKSLNLREKEFEAKSGDQRKFFEGTSEAQQKLKAAMKEIQDLQHKLGSAEHRASLVDGDIGAHRQDTLKYREELNHTQMSLQTVRNELTEAVKDAEHQRAVAKRLSAEAERVAQERALAAETGEKRLQIERESRARERESYLQELGALKEEARISLNLEQKRWSGDREDFEKRERETHRAYLGIKEAAEAEVSAHESTRARLEDTELQLRQTRGEMQNLRSLYEDAKNCLATTNLRPLVENKPQWPSNPASFPKAPPPGYTLSKQQTRGAPLKHLEVNPEIEESKLRKVALEQEEMMLNKSQMERRLRMSTLGADEPSLGGGLEFANAKSDQRRLDLESRDRIEAQMRATADQERQRIEVQQLALEKEMEAKLRETTIREQDRVAQLEKEMAERERSSREEMEAMRRKMADLEKSKGEDVQMQRLETDRLREQDKERDLRRQEEEHRRHLEKEKMREREEADRHLAAEAARRDREEADRRMKEDADQARVESERQRDVELKRAKEAEGMRQREFEEQEKKQEAEAKLSKDRADAEAEERKKTAADAVREAKERQELHEREEREAEERKKKKEQEEGEKARLKAEEAQREAEQRRQEAAERDVRSPSPIENESVEFSSADDIILDDDF